MTALTAGTGNPVCPFSIKKSAKMSVFICENRKNPLMARGSAPRPPVAVMHIEDHSYENISRQRDPVVRSVVFATAMIARLTVQLPPKPRFCVLG